MPDDKDKGSEAVQAAAEVIGKLEEHRDGKPPSRIQHLTALLIAAGALVTSTGAAIKTCDHSVTENTYATLTVDIQKVTDEQQKNREDIVALRGYLEGLSRAPLTVSTAVVDAGAPPTSPIAAANLPPTSRPPVRPSSPASSPIATPPDGGAIKFAIQAPPIPTVHPAPAPFQAKSWGDVAAGR